MGEGARSRTGISRKDAKIQRKPQRPNLVLLCAFAPLREKPYFSSSGSRTPTVSTASRSISSSTRPAAAMRRAALSAASCTKCPACPRVHSQRTLCDFAARSNRSHHGRFAFLRKRPFIVSTTYFESVNTWTWQGRFNLSSPTAAAAISACWFVALPKYSPKARQCPSYPSNATAAARLASCPLPKLEPSQKIATCWSAEVCGLSFRTVEI